MKSMNCFLLCTAALLLFNLYGIAIAAPPPAAYVTLLKGEGTAATSDGTVRALAHGYAVYSGDTVSTGPATILGLKFSDGGLVVLRPGSRFRIADFQDTHNNLASWNTAASAAPAAAMPDDSNSRAFFELLKGGFRAVSGGIGKAHHQQYRIQTPVATVGVRGTDYVAVICDAACAKDPVIAAALPSGAHAEGGLVAGVVHGRIAVGNKQLCPDQLQKNDSSNSCTEISAGQYLLTTAEGQELALSREPTFLRVDPLPDPKSCAD